MKKKIIKNIDLIYIILSIATVIIALLLEKFSNANYYVILSIYILSYIICGQKTINRTINNIFHLQFFDENSLMTVASIGAFIIGKPLEAVGVMILYNIGLLFQKTAIKKSKNSIKEVVKLRSNYADKLVDNNYIRTPVEGIVIGDIIRVRVGEKIPLDGIIVEGTTTVDLSMLTGESLPQDKDIKDNVYSGSINLSGIIYIKVTKLVEDSTASKIIELIENSNNKKSKSELFVNKFAKYYTPIVIILAFIIAIIPPLVDEQWLVWVYRAMSFLVISCPCSIVISVPLAYFVAIGNSAKNGILIKGGAYLDKLNTIDTFVFDKTGTLTKGNFNIKEVEILDNHEEFYTLIASLESNSTHPIAKIIANKYNNYIKEDLFDSVEEKIGNGLVGICNNHNIIVGKHEFVEFYNVKLPIVKDIGSVIYLAKDTTCLGYIIVEDELKEGAKEFINDLNNNKNTIMLTGDNKDIAEDIRQKTGIKNAYSNLLPEDKLNIVDKMIANKNIVCYLGDGINDAPVISRADVSIAMGNGSDIAVENADIILLNGDISKLKYLLKISKKTRRIVFENIEFSLIVKIIVMILSGLGITSMWLSVFSDVGVMILCIINSLRLIINKKD